MVKRLGGRVHGFDQLPSYPEFQGPGDCEPLPFTTVLCHPEKLDQPLRWRKPRRVFVCSMSDLFHQDVPDEFIAAVWGWMARSPKHTFMVLTKRPHRALAFLDRCRDAEAMGWMTHDGTLPAGAYEGTGIIVGTSDSWPAKNVWLGVSVEDQKTADERIPHLLATPAAVRFVSCEPMLGPVDVYGGDPDPRLGGVEAGPGLSLEAFWMPGDNMNGPPRPGLDWVICGGESGPGARPMHPDWARSLRDQCQAAGVPFFFKQVGEWGWASHVSGGQIEKAICPHGHVADFTRDGMIAACRDCTAWEGLRRVGKKAAGRELDGRTHDEFPEVRP
jgi:protein gp37